MIIKCGSPGLNGCLCSLKKETIRKKYKSKNENIILYLCEEQIKRYGKFWFQGGGHYLYEFKLFSGNIYEIKEDKELKCRKNG